MIHLTESDSSLIVSIVTIAIRNLALAGGVGLAMLMLRVRESSTRLFTWKAVLYGALAMPLLSWMLPGLQVQIPAALQEQIIGARAPNPAAAEMVNNRTAAQTSIHGHATQVVQIGTTSRAKLGPTSLPSASETATNRAPIPWGRIAVWTYLSFAFLLLARLLVGTILTLRLVASCSRISDAQVAERMASTARAYGLRRTPRVLESDRVTVPITCGTLNPTVLLPLSWRRWSDQKLEAVIAHEMSHVSRGDAVTQFMSLLHRAVFWFSPWAWWLDRQLAHLAEQASDEAALARGADRNAYARTLLDFFQALQLTPGRVRWQGVAMTQASLTEQRLERILAWKGAVSMGAKKSIVFAFIVFAIPVLYLAAAVRPGHEVAVQEPAKTASVPVPSKAPAAAVPESPAAGAAVTALPTPASPAAVDELPAPVAEHPDSESEEQNVSSGMGHSYSYGYDDEERFVIVSGKSDSLTMSGNSEDARHAQKLKKTIPGDFIWFERDEKSYIIQDAALIERARKLWLPQEELGRKQEELGKQQEELGRQQEELGKKMEEVRVQVPDMTAELDKLKAELKALSSGATVEQVGNLQSEIGELQGKIGEIQSHAGDQQSKLGEEMGALGEKQGKLGEQQGKLGERQGELARKAVREMRILLDQAIKNGKAKPESAEGSGASL